MQNRFTSSDDEQARSDLAAHHRSVMRCNVICDMRCASCFWRVSRLTVQMQAQGRQCFGRRQQTL